MGCASSTHVVTDHQGQQKTKHKMGGSYPGNRRTPQQAYTPDPSQFNSQGQATTHFISYGGGNALVLQQGGIAQPQVGQKQAQYVQVTLPAGVEAGQKIHVQAPDGRLNEIMIPDGFGPGSTFTVEFADQPKTSAPPPPPPQSTYPTAAATPANNDHDDGFASGFQNPSFVPSAVPAPAASFGTDNDIDLSSYPAATDVKPVYASAPTYSATTY